MHGIASRFSMGLVDKGEGKRECFGLVWNSHSKNLHN